LKNTDAVAPSSS